MTSILKNSFGILGSLLFRKKPKAQQQQALPQVTRDDAAAQMAADDELRRRKGSAADILTGTLGAETAAGQVGKLVVGS